jgi:hypothetical protein
LVAKPVRLCAIHWMWSMADSHSQEGSRPKKARAQNDPNRQNGQNGQNGSGNRENFSEYSETSKT